MLVECADEALGRSGASAKNANRPIEFPAAGILFEVIENTKPDGGNAAGEGHTVLLNEIEDAFAVDVGSGEDETRAGHGTGVGQAPGVGVEHGGNGENRVLLADAEGIGHSLGESVQDQRAVRVDDTLGVAGGAGGETHDRAVIFVDVGISEVVGSRGEQIFVAFEALARGDGIAGVRDDENAFEWDGSAKLFKDRQEAIIDQQKSVARRVGDGGDFVRMQPQIERVQDAAGAGNAEKGF